MCLIKECICWWKESWCYQNARYSYKKSVRLLKFGNERRVYAKPQIRHTANFWFMLMIPRSRWSAVGIESRPRAGRSGVRTTVEVRDFSQWNVPGQTAPSRCKGFPTFQGLTPSQSTECCFRATPCRWVSPLNVRKPSHLDAAVCPRNFHWLLSPQKLQDLQDIFLSSKSPDQLFGPPSLLFSGHRGWVISGFRRGVNESFAFFLAFLLPRIVINFFVIKPTRCTNLTNLFCHETLHASENSSVHHQEFIHCTLSNGTCHTSL